jgi:DNA primase
MKFKRNAIILFMEAVTLAELTNFDPRPLRQGGRSRYLCSLSGMCREKPRDDAHRSLAVEDSSGVFYCHRCGEKGRLREFWEKREVGKSLKNIKLRQRTALRPVESKPVEEKKTDLEMLRERMENFRQAFRNSAAHRYLLSREIPAKISLNAGCGYAQSWEHWRRKNGQWDLAGTDERVVFPVFDENRQLIAFHGRAINDRHLNSAKITKGNKSQGVFLSSIDVFESPIVAICEGPVDALALETCGVPAVAMIGTTAPKWLAGSLRGKAVLIATDADAAGDEGAKKLAAALQPYSKDVYRLRPQLGKDWGEELEIAGAARKRKALIPFAAKTDDVTRANSSWQFVMDGDYDTAEFVAGQILDIELRKSFLVLIHKEYVMAA